MAILRYLCPLNFTASPCFPSGDGIGLDLGHIIHTRRKELNQRLQNLPLRRYLFLQPTLQDTSSSNKYLNALQLETDLDGGFNI